MTYNELVKILTKNGWELKKHGGNHDKYYHSEKKDLYITIPRHGSQEVKNGTLNKILRDAGLK